MEARDEARFWGKVQKGAPDECWPWTASTFRPGYGKFKLDGRVVYAHRLAFELGHGPIPPPPRNHILHSCDRPICCNPAHLRAGTNAENQAEKAARGRHPRISLGGIKNGNAKLSAADVKAIRASSESCRALAPQFGVSYSVIAEVKRGASYVGV